MSGRKPLSHTFRIFLTLALCLVGLSQCENYDTLVQKDQVCQQRWADIDAQLQRRSDLIPNLVATVKGSAAHEEQVLREVTEARASAGSMHLTGEDLQDPDKMAAFQKAQGDVKSAISRLLVVQEKYPEIAANQNFHALQVQLEGTENRILRAREVYNAAVADYNTELNKIRGSAVNKLTGKTFKPHLPYSAEASARALPTVSF